MPPNLSSSPSTSPPRDQFEPPTPSPTTQGLKFRKDKQRSRPPSPEGANSRQTNGSGSVPPVPQNRSTPTHSPSASQSSTTGRYPASAVAARALSPSVAGPSSPRSALSNLTTRKSVMNGENGNGGEWKRGSGTLSTRDELLMSLLSSEAVVDSRGYDILSAEEVDDLKKEHQVLSSRLVAMRKKLALETKIRDAAINLAKVNVASKRASKQSSEQVDTANRKVDTAQRELWKILERASDVHRRLLEHRAGVLSHSIRDLERKAGTESTAGGNESGYSTPSRSAQISPVSSVTSMSISSKGRFDGAHLFAGHEGAVVPRRARPPPTAADMLTLEQRVKQLMDELDEKDGELAMLREERLELEGQVRGGGDMEQRVRELEDLIGRHEREREGWELERRSWDDREGELEEMKRLADEKGREVEILERRLEVLEEQSGESVTLRENLMRVEAAGKAETARTREELEAEREKWAEERGMWDRERAAWDTQREVWEMEKEGIEGRCKDEIDDAREGLRAIVQAHDVPLYSRELTLQVLVDALGKYLQAGGGSAKGQSELEEQLALEMEKRQAVLAQLDEAQAKIASLEKSLKERPAETFITERIPSAPIDFVADAKQIVALLEPIWATLPSPEARATASRPGAARLFRTGSGSPTAGPGSPKVAPSSISDMDVRSLKSLYSGNANGAADKDGKGAGTFSVEAFATRVQALIMDDRMLIERLIRFAQAHDLLKKNAERAQKLALDSNAALETYQKQVKTLEDRHKANTERLSALQHEVQELEDTVDRLETEKRDLEMQAAEQGEACRELTDANASLSARTLTLAEEAASSSVSTEEVRRKMDAQLSEARAALERAKEEIATMQMREQTQRIALLEELNTMQTENGNLRTQLRAAGKI
ncbi:hypothetical protein EWM64_g3500 [Hericium alpestre]|uniref:Up-regulated during septation protein 1 domain-containing protein n=1 Tax=Hericium alpestre TaxID=135208 RepID=A0A4Z0A214_9AGAM|nr:hypothetical protein EWM64_g3500 [Hericium alpestre]